MFGRTCFHPISAIVSIYLIYSIILVLPLGIETAQACQLNPVSESTKLFTYIHQNCVTNTFSLHKIRY